MKSASMPSGSWAGRLAALFVGLALAFPVHAQGNLEIDTPAISALRKTMQQRHAQLAVGGVLGLSGRRAAAQNNNTVVVYAHPKAVTSLAFSP